VGFLVLFSYRKRTRPPRLWAEWNYKCLVGTTKQKNICFCLWQRIFDTFFLMKKYPKHQERTMLPPHRAKHLARRSFIPTLGNCSSFCICF
jgi:hypothetical protein